MNWETLFERTESIDVTVADVQDALGVQRANRRDGTEAR